MSNRIELADLRRLIDTGAQLVEVLPAGEYEEAHLPGAINIRSGRAVPRSGTQASRRGARAQCLARLERLEPLPISRSLALAPLKQRSPPPYRSRRGEGG